MAEVAATSAAVASSTVPASGEDPAVGEEEGELPSWETFDYGGGFKEVAIVKSIEEYLGYHYLGKSLEAFNRDVERVGLKHTPSRASESAARDVECVMADFDVGRREDFALGWERVMPEEFRLGHEGRSLELRLQAHFAIFRARKALEEGNEPSAQELREDLEPFRNFLGERGLDEVCGDEELMPLFALPFVQRPFAQPQVRDVFAARWLRKLRDDVEAALRSRQPSVPLLYELMEMQMAGGPAGERAWQATWAELFRVADAGLDTAAMSALGTSLPAEPLLEGRRQLDKLREQVPGGMELRLSSQLAGSLGAASPTRGIRSRAATAPPQMPRDIDFRRLGQFVAAQADNPRRVGGAQAQSPTLDAVLRAMLQRLASAELPVSQRRGFLVSMACFDALGVRSSPETLPALLGDPAVAELTLGILAVLACESIGRTYVVANLSCVNKVIELIKVQPLDSSLHIQALAALQRLSLRRAPQNRMIEKGVVEWVVGVLGWQQESLQGMPSEFSIEFGSALLMNLALRTAGKRRCAELDTLRIALNLMEHWNPQIRTHINGTLYSLLSDKGFRERAQAAGLEGVLKSIHSQATSLGDEISKRQIEYLLEQLNPPDTSASTTDGAESGEDDEDDDENFLEEEELASVLLGDRSGQSAAEALRGFIAISPAIIESQHAEFRDYLARASAAR